MKPALRPWLAAGMVATFALGGCALFKASSRPAPSADVPRTTERVARGAYLVKNVAACMSCHSPLDPDTHAPLPGQVGAGGRVFGGAGFPFEIYSTNLTADPETGIGDWTDGEVLRAMREGVSRDGHALFPIMPYHNYAQLSDADAEAIVAYLRTLKPVKHAVPERKLNFPLNLIVNTMPRPLEAPVPAPGSEPLANGKYMFTMSSCAECHTPMNGGQPDTSRPGAGGMEFPGDGPNRTTLVSPNITPDKATGVGNWTDLQLKNAIRFGQRPDGTIINPLMPWPSYNGMSQKDLNDLVAYMRTLKPIENKVEAPKQ